MALAVAPDDALAAAPAAVVDAGLAAKALEGASDPKTSPAQAIRRDAGAARALRPR
jgi:hypothetical protein